VPFEEDENDPSIWFLDHSYLEKMGGMFRRINGTYARLRRRDRDGLPIDHGRDPTLVRFKPRLSRQNDSCLWPDFSHFWILAYAHPTPSYHLRRAFSPYCMSFSPFTSPFHPSSQRKDRGVVQHRPQDPHRGS
jgi:hypothetical protein